MQNPDAKEVPVAEARAEFSVKLGNRCEDCRCTTVTQPAFQGCPVHMFTSPFPSRQMTFEGKGGCLAFARVLLLQRSCSTRRM